VLRTRTSALAHLRSRRPSIQITFTDLDLASFPVPSGSILPLFAQLGLVDASYRAKTALAVWDSVLALR
jgi:hypothetical protein